MGNDVISGIYFYDMMSEHHDLIIVEEHIRGSMFQRHIHTQRGKKKELD